MKLRNKKTGEITETHLLVVQSVEDPTKRYYAGSIKDLCDNYEDYKPAEPLKDDKMRQCLNLWSDINGYKGELTYAEGEDWCSFYEEEKEAELVFSGRICPNLKNGESYSIAELCGEEEE